METSAVLLSFLEEPIWLIKEEQVCEKSKGAQNFEAAYRFSLEKVLEVSRGQACAFHATVDTCMNCPLDHTWSSDGFPLILLDHEGEGYQFWVKLNDYDGKRQLLQIFAKEHQPKSEDTQLMTKYLNDARELERKQIARDLHDGIAQSIYSLMLETRGVKWTPANEQPQKLQAIDRHFADVLQEVRDLATEMRPASLDDLGLAASLEQLCEQTSAMTGFKIMFSTKGTPRPLAEKQRTAVFRIVQEGIANAMKYAEVSEMEVALNFHEPLLEVKLRDYGKGFDQTAVHYGFGLLNMQERARSAKGSVMVHSEQEKGTEILVKLPYLEE